MRKVIKLISLEDEDQALDDYCNMKPLIKLNEVPEILEKEVDYLISPQLINFLKRFKISTKFLHINPELWRNNED